MMNHWEYVCASGLLIFGLMMGCQPQHSTTQTSYGDSQTYSSSDSQPESKEEPATDPSEYVSALVIRSAEFQLIAPQISYQIVEGVNFPVMSYMLPQQSDYIEILRCDAGLQLTNFAGNTVNELNMMADEDASLQMIAGDFWQKAMASQRCVMVGYEYSQHSQFTDTTIRSGRWFYLARACVMAQKISALDRPGLGLSSCSPFVAQTAVFDYTSPSELAGLANMVALSEKGIALEHAVLRLERLAVATHDALEHCDDQEADRQKRVREKKALMTIITTVISVAADFALPGGQSYTPAKGIWGKGKNLAKRMGSIEYMSRGISNVLNGFTTSVDDFPQSCYEGDRLNRDLHITADEVERLNNEYQELVKAI